MLGKFINVLCLPKKIMQNAKYSHLFAHFVSILIIQPKVIDVSLVTTFGILLILIWALPEEGAYVKSDVIAYFDAWIFGGFAADITTAWVCFKVPFAKQLYMDEVSEEELTHPGTKYLIKETTLAFICGFGMAGMFAIVRGSLMVTGNNTNTLNIVMQVLMWCSVAYGINMAAWVLPKYGTSDKFNNMIAEKYGEEVEAWNAKHPDHEWAKEWAKAIEAETE